MQGEARCFVKREGLQVFILAFLWGPDRKKKTPATWTADVNLTRKGLFVHVASKGRRANQADRTALLFVLQNAAILVLLPW